MFSITLILLILSVFNIEKKKRNLISLFLGCKSFRANRFFILITTAQIDLFF